MTRARGADCLTCLKRGVKIEVDAADCPGFGVNRINMRISVAILIFFVLAAQIVAQMGAGGAGGGMGGFGGPAVMGRGTGSGTGQRGGSDMGLGFFAGVQGSYDNGLTGLSLNSSGQLTNGASLGVDGYAGVFGSKRIRRGSFGINYVGHYRHYTRISNFNGADQNLSIFTNRQLTKRSTLSFNASGGTTNRPFGMQMFGMNMDSMGGGIFAPNAELFDNRIYYGSGGLEYVLQKSARLSYGMSGSGFFTRRTGSILFGVTGTSASGNVAYRISRRQTISVGYQFIFFNFTRNFGDTYGNGAQVGYSIQMGKRTQFAFQGGAMRLESLGLRSSQLDPVIAALIGVSTVQEVFYNTFYLPTGNASLTFQPNRLHSFSVSAGMMASPGNGVINTSRMTSAGAMYNYTGIRNLGINVSSFYNRMSSLVGDNQSFESMQTTLGLSRRINSQLFASFNLGNRRFLQSSTNTFQRNSNFAALGITWSPKEIPISIR